LRFFGKMTSYSNMFKILLRKFALRHWSTCRVQIREIWPTGNQWNRALLTWQKRKFLPALQLLLLCELCPKSARTSPSVLTTICHPCSEVPLPTGDLGPHIIYGSLGLHESSAQMESRSFQLFLRSLPVCAIHTDTQTVTRDICSNRPHLCAVCRLCGLIAMAAASMQHKQKQWHWC